VARAPTPFIILFQGRTGSSWLQDLLRSHPGVVCEPERLVGASRADQWAWLDGLYSASRPAGIAATGCKTKLKDIVEPADLHALIHAHQVRVIHMYRRNRVKQAFSRINARRLFDARRRWNLAAGEQPLPPARIPLEQFEAALEHHRALEARLATFLAGVERPRLDVAYEDLLHEHDATMGAVCRFLGVAEAPMATGLRKNTPEHVRDAVLNYDEIREHYRGTDLEAEFD